MTLAVRSWLIAGVVLPALLGVDLDPGYYLHLVRGQFRLLWDRERIDRVLARSDLDPTVRDRLLFVQDVRRFGEEAIGLEASRNYTTFCDIGRGPVSWQLTAAPKDRLQALVWTYPVVGPFPYRGYFDRGRAERDRAKLEAKGYDTYLRPVGAYSTLGWFKDPVLSTMLRYRDEDLAELILHELTHGTVWVAEDVAFNEGLATFVGQAGAIAFLESRHGRGAQQIQDALDRRADRRLFRAFMHEIAAELEATYASDDSFDAKMAGREGAFTRARKRFADLDLRTDMYSGFPSWKLNNAHLMAYRTYHLEIGVFEQVYEKAGRDLATAMAAFRSCEAARDPRGCLEAWAAGGD
ncbi:MAG: aminopeptidase [Candidatus Latescibacteria bacterium]|nr:aminopeptidase [Candidatus Latescibacterota bacterium]